MPVKFQICQAPEGIKVSPEKPLPKRLLIVPWGKSETREGPVIVNDETEAVLHGNQIAKKFDRVPLDFNHNTVSGSPTYQKEPNQVAAWGIPEVVHGEGIFLNSIDWTPVGEEMARGGHYPDLSPALLKDEASGVVQFIHSAALCRNGEIDGLRFSLNSATFDLSTFSAKTQTPKKGKSTMDYKALLLTCLGLPQEATDDEIQTRVKAAQSDDDDEPNNPEDKPGDAVRALSAQVAKLTTQVQTFSATTEKTEREAIVAKATRDGKVIPLSAEDITRTPITILSAMVEKLPVTVALDRQTPENIEVHGASALGGDTTQSESIRKNMGISEDDWKKFDPKKK